MQGSISEVKLELVHRDGGTIPIVVNALVRNDHGVKVHEIAAYIAMDREQLELDVRDLEARQCPALLVALPGRPQLEGPLPARAIGRNLKLGIDEGVISFGVSALRSR